MSEQLTLDTKEIVHGHWHVSGERKYDAVIQLLKNANRALTIGVHDSDEVILRMTNMLPNCEVVYADVPVDVDIFIAPALSVDQAMYFQNLVPIGVGAYTLANWEKKTETGRVTVNRLTVSDGKIQGIVRYKGEDKE